jgi:Methyltransferase domain
MINDTFTANDRLIVHAQSQLAVEQHEAWRPCKICGEPSRRFDMLDFEKFVSYAPYSRALSCVPVVYRRCDACGFIFTSFFDSFSPAQWSEHIYNDEYRVVDGEFEEIRPAVDAKVVQAYFGDLRSQAIGLDFGGGNGRTARLLRESGWTFDCFDPFGVDELKPDRVGRYNLCTAFEVLEHLPRPVDSISTLLQKASDGPLMFMIGTALTDGQVNEATRLAWFYAGPRNGHISLFSRRSLQWLAQRFGLEYSNVSPSTHILSRGHDPAMIVRRLRTGRMKMLVRRKILRT